MDNDWASPWADAGDRSPAEVIKNLDAQDAEDATRSRGSGPEPQIPNSNVAVHTNDPWGGGEHGFGDVSAWASSSPGIGAGKISSVRGGPVLPAWDEPISVEVPSFFVDKAKDEKEGSPDAVVITSQETGTGKTGEWFGDRVHSTITTDEAEVWAAGSDWGETKSEQTEDFPVERTGLSPEITSENIPFPEFDASTDTAIQAESIKEDQFANATTLNHELAEHKIETNSTKEPGDVVKVSVEDIPTILELKSSVEDSKHESESVKEAEVIENAIGKKNVNEEELRGEEAEDDDFGDFVDEEDFEDAEEILPRDVPVSVGELPFLPPTPELRPDITFDIQTSLINKLYPISTAYPKPPPIEELIHTTDSRKVWYRLSQSGTIRRDKSGDDNYVRVTWHGSKVQEGVNKIIVRWMAEDRNSGTGVALGGSRRLGAMFGWGESVENKTAPVQLRTNSSARSSVGVSSVNGTMKSPLRISTTATHQVESRISPQAASFGWSHMDNSQPAAGSHPSSCATSTKGEDKPPSTPSRGSFYGTSGSSRMSSQPVTPSRSTKPHSPIGSNHSRQTSHSLTQPSSPSLQSIRRSAEVAKNIIPPTRTNNFCSSNPAASKSASPPATATISAPNSNFDEWGAFENMATVKLPSTKEANCNFDEPGALRDTTKVINTKPSGGVSVQNQISGLPVGASEVEEKTIESKEDEWGAFEELGVTSKTASFSGSSHGLFVHAPMKLKKRPDSKGKTDALGSLTGPEDPLTVKPSVSHQQLSILSTNIPDGLHLNPAVRAGLNAQEKTDHWDSFDAFENFSTPKPPVSVLPATNVVEGSKLISVEASSSKVQSIDNWGSFEAFESALTSKTSVSSQSLKMSSMQPPGGSYAKPADKLVSKNQKVDNWSSFNTLGKLQPKAVSGFNLPALSISNGATAKPNIRHAPPPDLSTPVAVEGDVDDWGEMVQSPQIPNGSSSFEFVMQPAPTTPSTMSPPPLQFTQPQPQAVASAMSMYDFGSFETKMSVPASASKPTNGGDTDTWDLSFFDGPTSSNKTSLNVSAFSSNQLSHNLWDSPAPTIAGRRLNAEELEEDKVVNNIVEGLPDLSYMLS